MKHLFCAVALCLSLCSTALAATVDFTDNTIVWPGLTHSYVNNKGRSVSVGAELPQQDQNGVPDLTGGSFVFNGSLLTQVVLTYQDLMPSSWNSIWNAQTPGDWYFDLNPGGSRKAWDYVIHWDGKLNTTNVPDSYHLYKAVDYWGYAEDTLYMPDKTGSAGRFKQYNGYYGNSDERDWHPTTIKDPSGKAFIDLGPVGYSGWTEAKDLKNGKGQSVWDLSGVLGGGLNMADVPGNAFTYGFTLTCANDVLFDQAPIPNPEPSTLALAALGTAGAAWTRLRRKT